MKLDNRGSWTLIGLLAAVAIVMILGAVYFASPGDVTSVGKNTELLDKASRKKTVVGQSMDTAKREQCRQQLSQIRTGIESYKAMGTSEANPPTLKDIGLGVSVDYFQCPVSLQPYTYDPGTGKVACPTHPEM